MAHSHLSSPTPISTAITLSIEKLLSVKTSEQHFSCHSDLVLVLLGVNQPHEVQYSSPASLCFAKRIIKIKKGDKSARVNTELTSFTCTLTYNLLISM